MNCHAERQFWRKSEYLTMKRKGVCTGESWIYCSDWGSLDLGKQYCTSYIGVTANIIDRKWQLQSFALTHTWPSTGTMLKMLQMILTCGRGLANPKKVTTIGTDCTRTMTAAAKKLPFQHMPCTAHILQRTIIVCLGDSRFTDTLTIVGHFKHSPANTEELQQQHAALGHKKSHWHRTFPHGAIHSCTWSLICWWTKRLWRPL